MPHVTEHTPKVSTRSVKPYACESSREKRQQDRQTASQPDRQTDTQTDCSKPLFSTFWGLCIPNPVLSRSRFFARCQYFHWHGSKNKKISQPTVKVVPSSLVPIRVTGKKNVLKPTQILESTKKKGQYFPLVHLRYNDVGWVLHLQNRRKISLRSYFVILRHKGFSSVQKKLWGSFVSRRFLMRRFPGRWAPFLGTRGDFWWVHMGRNLSGMRTVVLRAIMSHGELMYSTTKEAQVGIIV